MEVADAGSKLQHEYTSYSPPRSPDQKNCSTSTVSIIRTPLDKDDIWIAGLQQETGGFDSKNKVKSEGRQTYVLTYAHNGHRGAAAQVNALCTDD